MKASLLVLLVLLGGALCQQRDLFPIRADGFETVWLDDMSFVSEINYQSIGHNASNITFYAYGDGRLRTVFPGPNFHVGSTPNENWHLPFIDFHTFTDANDDLWGIGPINALHVRNRTGVSSFQFEIAVISTALYENGRGRLFLEQPIGFEGTFYSVRVGAYGNNVVGFFAGFFPDNATDNLHFGIRRAHFNVSQFNSTAYDPTAAYWTFDPLVDEAIIHHDAELVTFNEYFKPHVLHAEAVDPTAPAGTYWIVVVDPYFSMLSLVTGNRDRTVPLNVTSRSWVPTFANQIVGNIVSTVVWNQFVLVGVAVKGQGTGWIDVLYLTNLTQHVPSIVLPGNFSDPRALVYDWLAPIPTLYVGMNGGWAIVKIDLTTFKVVGYQNLPEYLHRTWRGRPTHEHLYFVTNEQHSKVYRLSKADFCPNLCPRYGYCLHGQCVCGENWVMKSGECHWRSYETEKTLVAKEKAGEITLGIFFAIAVIAAAAGWYIVWKNRRGYQAV